MRWTVVCLAAVALSAACKRNQPRQPEPPPAAPAAAPPGSHLEGPPGVPAGLLTPPADAWGTPSGLSYRVVSPGGGGQHPAPDDLVEVHFTGWASDGKIFDSAVAPASSQFQLDTAMPGWREALAHMVEGEKRRLWVPAKLTYGEDNPRHRMPPGPLVFDLELVKIIKPAPPVPAPSDVARPPRNARRLRSGAVWRSLARGKGHRHPRPRDTVQVHYTRWTPDGKMIDSSRTTGQPTTMRSDSLGPVWSEALRCLVPGAKGRFWMPAVKVKWTGPATTVVYDIELVAIK